MLLELQKPEPFSHDAKYLSINSRESFGRMRNKEAMNEREKGWYQPSCPPQSPGNGELQPKHGHQWLELLDLLANKQTTDAK
jgi:hypothetical protein